MMNPNEIKENAEQRVPLLPHAVNGHQHNNDDIPFVDELISAERKASLRERQNPELPITPLVDERNTRKTFTAKLDANSRSSADDSDGDEIKLDVQNVGRNLRRNSISMPSGINALDMEKLRLTQQEIQEQESLSEEDIANDSQRESSIVDDEGSISFSVPEKVPTVTTIHYENENESSDDEFGKNGRKPITRDRFRNKRRASIAPLPALRLNSREMLASDFDTHSLASNQTSITSINSLASLLREKMQAFPQMIRKKKRETKDYKIKIFVTIMFFIIIFLIGYAYVGYHQFLRTRSVFDKIKFNAQSRIFQIFSHDEKQVISGHLGVTLNSDSNPFHCLEDNRKTDGSVCMEWNGIARLYMNFDDMDVFRCYTLKWQALSSGFFPTDCYELTRDNGLWFGGSITKGMDWSLNTANFDFAPFSSGDTTVHQFGNAIKRYLINSIGVAIQVNEKTPLHLSVNRTKNQLCLRAMNNEFSFVNHLTPLPELDYKICTTEGIRNLHMLMTQKSLWDGLKESDIKILQSLIEEPVWKVPFESKVESINETTIYKYSEEVITLGLGHILVNEFWQENIGDFTVDRLRFPTLKDTLDVLHRRGFKIVFTIQPFISTDSPSFRDAVKNKLLIYERHSDRSIPALTRYKSSPSAGVLDITNNASVPWLMKKLDALKKEYQVDSFYLDLGTGYNLPHYYQCNETLDNPDKYANLFTQKMQDAGFIGVSTASVVPKPPAFLSLPPTNSSWRGLREVLSTVLNYGVLGYPFVLPGAIGGDFSLNRKINKMVSFYSLGQPELPEPELYIRWLQLVTFLPSMQFSHLPSEYKDDYVTGIAKELSIIRLKTVIPMLKKYLSESMNEGLPLVRPLWMLDPNDPACLVVNDEFSVGEEIIVAPILEKSKDEREVYLPQGVWKDGIDGSLRKGSRWIHSYKVPKDKVAYFIKMPDNTRF